MLRNYGVYIIVRLYFRLTFSKNSPLSFGCKPKIMKADDYDGDNSDSIEVRHSLLSDILWEYKHTISFNFHFISCNSSTNMLRFNHSPRFTPPLPGKVDESSRSVRIQFGVPGLELYTRGEPRGVWPRHQVYRSSAKSRILPSSSYRQHKIRYEFNLIS